MGGVHPDDRDAFDDFLVAVPLLQKTYPTSSGYGIRNATTGEAKRPHYTTRRVTYKIIFRCVKKEEIIDIIPTIGVGFFRNNGLAKMALGTMIRYRIRFAVLGARMNLTATAPLRQLPQHPHVNPQSLPHQTFYETMLQTQL